MIKTIQLLCVIFFTNNIIAQGPTFIKIPEGTFNMGSDSGRTNEIPKHEISLTKFSISQTEITVAQYRIFCEETNKDMPESPKWGWIDNHPIVNVSWDDAIGYCNWLGGKIKKDVKLPTEAQWEYVATGTRKRKKYIYSGGKKIESIGWTKVDDDSSSSHPVGTKKPNRLDVYDMSGNVWEWCMDWYSEDYYAQSLFVNPENTHLGQKKDRVARGGSWQSKANTCTVTHRINYKPTSRYVDRGFRVVIN